MRVRTKGKGIWARVAVALREELREHTRLHPSTRPWEMPLTAAITSGVPLLVGAGFGRMDFGLVASLGGFVFLSLPDTLMQHRMVLMMSVAGCLLCTGRADAFLPACDDRGAHANHRRSEIAVGSIVGLAGGAALHVPAFRSRVARVIKVALRSGA